MCVNRHKGMRRKGHEHMIAIIDYDAGNIKSVEKVMHLLGQEVVVTRDRESILKADKVILPGVGAFGDAMSKIRQYGLEEVIHEGEILRIPDQPGLKIPHMGWNSLKYPHEGRLFRGIPEDSYVYFVHSYYLKAEDESIVTATTEYSTLIHASVESGNVFACQFHPEKSSDVGIQILKNFVEL